MRRRWGQVGVVLLALVQGVPATATPRELPSGGSIVRVKDDARLQQRRFIRQTAAAAQAQVIAGRLASVRGSTPEVRGFGRKLMITHQKTARRLALLSLHTQVPVPSRPGRKDRSVIAQLRSRHGEAFDRLFLQHFGVEVQERELSWYRALLGQAGAEPGLLQLARSTLPTLRQQLQVARELLQQPGAASPPSAGASQPGGVSPAPAANPPGPQPEQQRNAGWDANDRDALEGVSRAADVLRTMKQDNRVDALLQDARGVLVFPQYRRGGIVLAVRSGKGVLVTRRGSAFSAPAFYRMEGASAGLQAGAATGPMVYLLMTDAAVAQFRSARQLSYDVLAAATLGRNSQQWQSSKGKVQDVIVWSGARGAYAGAAVGMTQIVPDADANRAYYGGDVSVSQILGGAVRNPYADVLARLLGS